MSLSLLLRLVEVAGQHVDGVRAADQRRRESARLPGREATPEGWYKGNIARAESLRDAALRTGLTRELKAGIEDALAKAREAKDELRISQEIQGMKSTVTQNQGFGAELVSAGFNLKSNPSVRLSAFAALAKAPALPGPTVLNPAAPKTVPLGRDSRFLWPALNRRDAGTNTPSPTSGRPPGR